MTATPLRTALPPARAASQDLLAGLRLWRLATALGWLDIRLQFQGARLGPLWLTVTSGVMAGSMGLIYSQLFHLVLRDYLPYLSISLILWQSGLALLVQESCTTFTQAASSIRSVRLPYTVQVLRTLTRCTLTLAHAMVVPLIVFAFFRLWPGWTLFLALPALGLWLATGAGLCLLLGCACARYRDITPIVGSVLQLVFYVTPVIWEARQLGHLGGWLVYNPCYAMLEILRAPLLGHTPRPILWLVAGGSGLAIWALALGVFTRCRAQLAFWV